MATTDRAKAALQKAKPAEQQEAASKTTLKQFLQVYEGRIKRLLPASIGLTPERMGELAVTEMKKTPRLMQADMTSLMGALIQAGKLGLEVGINAYLVPFFNSRRGCYEVNMIPDYRGLLALTRRSGEISSFSARPVYKKDLFDYQFGTDEFLRHKQLATDDERGESNIVFFYAIARYKSGGYQFDVMTKGDVDKIRARSKSGDDGPWVTDYEAMGNKTIAKRLCKFLPVSIEVQHAVQLDDLAESGRTQGNASVIDADYVVEGEDDNATVGATPKDAEKPPADAELTEEEKKAALEQEAKGAAGKA